MKVVKRENIENLVKDLRNQNKTIVMTNGCFDILHVGHVRYLQKTKSFADVLILALNTDKSIRTIKGEGRPINNENDRAEVLSALECVDYIVPFDENSPAELLKTVKPDVYTKGADYTLETLPETKVVQSFGGRIEFIDFVEGKSTTNLIQKIKTE